MKLSWTKEYCNMSYLECQKGFHVSVRRSNNWTEGTILNLNTDEPFTKRLFNETQYGDDHYEAMKQILEKRAKQLGII